MTGTNLATVASPRAPLRAGGNIAAIVPQDAEQAWRMAEMIAPRDVVIDVTIPYSRGDLVNRVHADGRVDAVEHTASGTRITARVPISLAVGLGEFATF